MCSPPPRRTNAVISHDQLGLACGDAVVCMHEAMRLVMTQSAPPQDRCIPLPALLCRQKPAQRHINDKTDRSKCLFTCISWKSASGKHELAEKITNCISVLAGHNAFLSDFCAASCEAFPGLGITASHYRIPSRGFMHHRATISKNAYISADIRRAAPLYLSKRSMC